jgi:hypothetical protein
MQQLVASISPESHITDLGGVMSLNVRLDAAGLVLRVHQPFVSRPRLLAVQQVRRCLDSQGLVVPAPVRWRDTMVFRCRNRWAELEEYLPHERPAPTFGSYVWMFKAMGTLHRALAPYTASGPLYAAALDGFTENPVEKLRSRLPFLRLSAWLLAHPAALLSKENGKE